MVVAVVVVVVAAAVMAVEEVLSCGHFPQLLQIDTLDVLLRGTIVNRIKFCR